MIKKCSINTGIFYALWTLVAVSLVAKLFHEGLLPLYTDRIYFVIRHITDGIFGMMPFSVGDFLYVVWILLGAKFFFDCCKSFFRGGWKHTTLRLIFFPLILWSVFYISWGLMYEHKRTMYRLGIEEVEVENPSDELRKIAIYATDRSVFWREKWVASDDFSEDGADYEPLKLEVEKLARSFAARFLRKENVPVQLKKATLPVLVSYMKASGYFNPFTGEAQLNTDIPAVQQPFTACHEIAHQLGFAREQEANLVGFLMCVQSDLPLFKYAAHLSLLRYTLYNLKRNGEIDLYRRLVSKCSEGIKRDFRTISGFWRQYDGVLDRATTVIFDSYLKSNGQKSGIKSYTLWVTLLMQYYHQYPPEGFGAISSR